MNAKIAFSVLSADFANMSRDLQYMEKAGVDLFHVDVMDGHFVPNLTFGMGMVSAIKRNCKLPLDVHLMVDNPNNYIETLAEIGVEFVTVHCEAERHLDRLINLIKKHGMKAGLALNPATPIATLENILYALDLVVVMSVNPGFGGQKFIPQSLSKIRQIKSISNDQGLNVNIQVDGGVNLQTAPLVRQAGANILVVGSALLNQEDTATTVRVMQGRQANV